MRYLFNTRCSACHTIGKGDAVGPDLANLTKQREPAWVARYLGEPDKMLADGALRLHIETESQVVRTGSKSSPSTVRTVSR